MKDTPYQIYVEYPYKFYCGGVGNKRADDILQEKLGHCAGSGTDFHTRDIDWWFGTEKEAMRAYKKLTKIPWLKTVKMLVSYTDMKVLEECKPSRQKGKK